MAYAVAAHECAGRRVVGTKAPGAIGLVVWRSDDDLRGVGYRGAPGIAAKQSGAADPGTRGIGGEITRKETVGGEVAVVVTAVIVPAAGVAVAQHAVIAG